MPEGFSTFDPFTGFGGPYAMHAQQAGYMRAGRVEHFKRSISGPVGGHVEPSMFGQGIGKMASIAQDATQAIQAYRSRSQAFSGSTSATAAAGPFSEEGEGSQNEVGTSTVAAGAFGHNTAPMLQSPSIRQGQGLRYDVGFGQKQKARQTSYNPSMSPALFPYR